MALPHKRNNDPSMDELRANCPPRSRDDKVYANRRPLQWEHLWSTSSGDYGKHTTGPSLRQYGDSNSSQIWQNHMWDTSNSDYGQQVGGKLERGTLLNKPNSPAQFSTSNAEYGDFDPRDAEAVNKIKKTNVS